MSSPSRFGRAGNTNNSSFSTTTKMSASSISRQTNTSTASSSVYALPTTFGGVSQTELEDLRQAYQLFDTEKKGRILVKDVRDVLESIMEKTSINNNTEDQHYHPSRTCTSGLHRVLSRIRSLPDNNNTQQQLSIDQFIQLMTQPDPNDKRSEIRKVFDLFDVERKGYINVEDLGRIAADLGETMERHELQEMIQRASSSSSTASSSASSSGKVYPQDFEAVMSKRLFS